MSQTIAGQGDSAPDGFLVVDKPVGITSHDVVAAVRRATGIRKCGHAGTLDPMATGVVVVAVGRSTRLIRFVQDTAKEYVATALFGVATDSLDADGTEIERVPLPVTRQAVIDASRSFVGQIDQIPPMVSALKQDGVRLYELARLGVEVERPARRVSVHELVIDSVGEGDYPEVSFRVVCGKGTYVRSLADDIARSLGGRAHLVALRRTSVGSLGLDRSIQVAELTGWRERLVSRAEATAHLPTSVVQTEDSRLVASGRRLLNPTDQIDGPMRIVDASGTLLAMYRAQGAELIPDVVLVG